MERLGGLLGGSGHSGEWIDCNVIGIKRGTRNVIELMYSVQSSSVLYDGYRGRIEEKMN